jgi:hypothetical protein
MYGKVNMNSIVRFALALLFCAMLSACVGSPCDNSVLSEAVSPDKKYIATVFAHDCGATAPFAKAVVIRTAGSEFHGNDVDEYVFTMRGDHAVSVHWDGPNQLVIERPAIASDIFKELASWNDVRVEQRSPP